MTMNAPAAPPPLVAHELPAARLCGSQPPHRVILVGHAAFAWLRKLQERAPGPRIDLRYLVEGALGLLQEHQALHDRWLQHSRQALVSHVSGRGGSGNSGAGLTSVQAEGAKARTQGAPASRGRHDDCKALQIHETLFQWLKGLQGTTRDPRLDMRYLVEGAFALIGEQPDVLPRVVSLARRSLREHLAELEHKAIEPFSLEKLQ